MSLQKETAILVPKKVFEKARELYDVGYYEKALELLQENKIEFDIYSDKNFKEVRIRKSK